VSQVDVNDDGTLKTDVGGPRAAADFHHTDDPFALFASWLKEAAAHEPSDANAMAVATVDQRGEPNLRMLLLKGLDDEPGPDRGFVFYTNLASNKAQELIAHPRAALLFHWKSLQRQVRVRGPITLVDPAEADSYFATRPRGSQVGAWASDQSRFLHSREHLEQRVADLEARFAGGPVPRPPHWSGFRLKPTEIEFWHDRPFRLHDRLVFRRPTPMEPWHKSRLYP